MYAIRNWYDDVIIVQNRKHARVKLNQERKRRGNVYPESSMGLKRKKEKKDAERNANEKT